jgi:hypothetical protein
VAAQYGGRSYVQSLRPTATDTDRLDDPVQAAKASLRRIARRAIALREEIAVLDNQLGALLAVTHPTTLAVFAMGPPGRVRRHGERRRTPLMGAFRGAQVQLMSRTQRPARRALAATTENLQGMEPPSIASRTGSGSPCATRFRCRLTVAIRPVNPSGSSRSLGQFEKTRCSTMDHDLRRLSRTRA